MILLSNLSKTIRTSRAELSGLAQEWNELLEDSQANSIFLTWEWVTTWLDTVYPDGRLFVIVVRDGDNRLVAIAPFYCSDLRLMGVVKYKCLRIIGDCQSGAEYGDVIVRTGFEEAAMAILRRVLMEHRAVWDCIWITGAAGWTDGPSRIRGMCHGEGFFIHERTREFALSQIPGTHVDFLQGLSKNLREQIRRKSRQLEKRHRVTFSAWERAEELPKILTHLFELHRKRWESVGQEGSFVRRPLMQRFYREFAPTALQQGWLRLYTLNLDGDIKAVQYGYAYDQAFHQLQEGFDPEFTNGLGNILRNQVFQVCIEEGLQEYDNLGGFSEHKRRWGAVTRKGYDLLIGHRSLKNRPLFYKQIWPSGRYLQEGRPASEGRSHD